MRRPALSLSLMRLVVDTSVLIGELLRKAGRERLSHPQLDLFLPEQMWNETQWELPQRIAQFGRHNGLAIPMQNELASICLAAVTCNVEVLPLAVYAAQETEARARSLRDPNDWPAVAAALSLDCAIWTNDNDFLGTGLPTWTTDTLEGWLSRAAKESGP